MGRRLADRLRPPRPPVSRAWSTAVDDPDRGPVTLTGRWSGRPADRTLIVVVHGLGGSADSFYSRRAAAAAEAIGLSCLRLNLRGADGSGEDIYHAGLTADLHAAMASAAAAPFDRIGLLGFSLGGHLALRYACEPGDPRVEAVAAVCAPLDLDLTSGRFDLPGRWLYRRYLLSTLKRLYRPVAARQPDALPLRRALAIRRIREWDDLIVAPRFGFDGALDYYRRMSVAGRLRELRLPALLVAAEHDPFVPARTVRPLLEPPPPRLRAIWVGRAGHVAFPTALDLGIDGAPPGLEAQLAAWLAGERLG